MKNKLTRCKEDASLYLNEENPGSESILGFGHQETNVYPRSEMLLPWDDDEPWRGYSRLDQISGKPPVTRQRYENIFSVLLLYSAWISPPQKKITPSITASKPTEHFSESEQLSIYQPSKNVGRPHLIWWSADPPFRAWITRTFILGCVSGCSATIPRTRPGEGVLDLMRFSLLWFCPLLDLDCSR